MTYYNHFWFHKEPFSQNFFNEPSLYCLFIIWRTLFRHKDPFVKQKGSSEFKGSLWTIRQKYYSMASWITFIFKSVSHSQCCCLSLSQDYFDLVMLCHGCEVMWFVNWSMYMSLFVWSLWQWRRKCTSVSTSSVLQWAHNISSLGNNVFLCLHLSMARLCTLSLYVVGIQLCCFVSLTVIRYSSNS